MLYMYLYVYMCVLKDKGFYFNKKKSCSIINPWNSIRFGYNLHSGLNGNISELHKCNLPFHNNRCEDISKTSKYWRVLTW